MTNEINMPREFEYTSQVAYCRALEGYCATLRAENEKLKTESRDAAFGLNDYFGKEITELTRQLDEYKQDAERYQYLRVTSNYEYDANDKGPQLIIPEQPDGAHEIDWKAEVDILVDAAIKGASHDNA